MVDPVEAELGTGEQVTGQVLLPGAAQDLERPRSLTAQRVELEAEP